jgi:hypothetical protein
MSDKAAEDRFLTNYERFRREYAKLHRLLEKTFIRQLVLPTEQEREALKGLPESDARVIDFENKVDADRAVFYLGRIAADDFGELLILSADGRGLGAYKILRGMYERVVTAAFIAKNPAEARAFMEDVAIKRWKLYQSAVEVNPAFKDKFSKEEIERLKQDYDTAKARRSISHCRKCGQPKTAEAWTRLDLASMARKADPVLAKLYPYCYLLPTFHIHATSFDIERRLRSMDSGCYGYREMSGKEAKDAVMMGHELILHLLRLQNKYFGLGLEGEIQARMDVFPRVWGEASTATNE